MKDENFHPDSLGWAMTGALLAAAAIRLLDRRKQLAERTEQSVSTGVFTTQEDFDDSQ
jgi:hypothetical protein